jgi:hypothetical protein
MVWIPIGVLEVIRRISFRFISVSCREKRGIPLVSWKRMVVPKDLGGYALKNIFIFLKYLATKGIWIKPSQRLMVEVGWKKVYLSKYYRGMYSKS